MMQIRQRDILPGRGRPQLKASVASPAICVDVVSLKPKNYARVRIPKTARLWNGGVACSLVRIHSRRPSTLDADAPA